MHLSTRARRTVALLTGAALAAAAGFGAVAQPASAAAAPNGSVTSDAIKGMVYTGGDAPNRVTVVMTGTAFLVSDTAPITIGTGCSPIPMGGGLFGAMCLAPKLNNGQLKRFTVHANGGDDVVTNSSAAGMNASGGNGNDVVNGGALSDGLTDIRGGDVLRGNGGDDDLSTDFSGDTLPDVLDGGAGHDDLRAGPTKDKVLGGDGDDTARAGLGADFIDLGTGTKDTVVYLENGRPDTRNVVSLDGTANDGENIGGQSEGDNVLGTEAVFGGHGPDVLIGSDNPDILDGNQGDDIVIGNRGADTLRGRGGADQLHSNGFLDLDVPDGAVDTLDGGTESDYCLVGFGDGDVTISCESVEQST
jgi:hypothetical protein